MRNLAFFLIILISCQTVTTENQPTELETFKMLPAWRLPSEKKKSDGQADQAFDFRIAHPKWYAATEAPKGKKFRALLEWEPSQALLLAYPGSMDANISMSIAMIAVHAAEHTDVYIVSKPQTAKDKFISYLKQGGLSQDMIDKKIHWFDFEANSIWMIDYGPFPLVDENDTIAFTDLRYYWDRYYDDAIPARIAEVWGITDYRGQMDFEGGNFQTDGLGRCYHTQGAFWENPDKSQEEVHQVMKEYLGCKSFVVLKPLSGEGTTHMDMFSKLTAPDRFVLGKYEPTQDSVNAKILDDNKEILEAVDLGDGKKLQIFRIPMPNNKGQGGKVWRTYTNSTMVKPVNLWPIYSVDKDIEKEAEAVWKEALPYWEHIGIVSDVIITWGGAMHCVSRTVPYGKFEKWIEDGKCGADNKCISEGGYDGECKDDLDCVGPKWLCICNDCASGCTPPKDQCMGITLEGCCMPDGTLKYCESNKIQTIKCGSWDQCGWDPNQKWYDCVNGTEGPEGFPKLCSGGPCESYTQKGTCEGNFLMLCENGILKGIDCAKQNMSCKKDPKDQTKSVCLSTQTEEPEPEFVEYGAEPSPEFILDVIENTVDNPSLDEDSTELEAEESVNQQLDVSEEDAEKSKSSGGGGCMIDNHNKILPPILLLGMFFTLRRKIV